MTGIIRLATGAEDLDRIRSLRWKVFHRELGLDYRGLEGPIDDYSRHYIVEVDGEVVAGTRVTDRCDGPLEDEFALDIDVWAEAFEDREIAQCTRLVVDPRYRGRNLLGPMLSRVYQDGGLRGIRVAFIDTPPVLVEMYRSWGYRCLGRRYLHSVLGVEYRVMVLIMDDLPYFEAVGSPLVELCGGDGGQRGREIYARYYGALSSGRSRDHDCQS